MKNVRNRIKIKFLSKDNEKIFKQQPKLTFNAIQVFYTIYDSYPFKQNTVVKDKPIYLGFTVLELSKILLYETYLDIFQPYFGPDKLRLHYMDSECFVLYIRTQKSINDSQNLDHTFEFSNLIKNYELFSKKIKTVVSKFKTETSKNVFLHEFMFRN